MNTKGPFHFATSVGVLLKSQDTNDPGDTLIKDSGDSWPRVQRALFISGCGISIAARLIKIRFYLAADAGSLVDGWIVGRAASGPSEIEFDDASCSWNFRERELIGRSETNRSDPMPTFLPSPYLQVKLRATNCTSTLSHPLRSSPWRPIRDSKTEFSIDRISRLVSITSVWARSVSSIKFQVRVSDRSESTFGENFNRTRFVSSRSDRVDRLIIEFVLGY